LVCEEESSKEESDSDTAVRSLGWSRGRERKGKDGGVGEEEGEEDEDAEEKEDNGKNRDEVSEKRAKWRLWFRS
jgi:hypothetical protein